MPDIFFDDIMFENKKWNNFLAYGQSKLANILMADEGARRLADSGVLFFSVHPSWINSNLGKDLIDRKDKEERGCLKQCCISLLLNCLTCSSCSSLYMEPEDGAQSSLFCCLSDPGDLKNGAFYSQNGIYKHKPSKKGGWPMELPNPNRKPLTATKLWDISLKLVGEAE